MLASSQTSPVSRSVPLLTEHSKRTVAMLGKEVTAPGLIQEESLTPSEKLFIRYLQDQGICPGNLEVMNQVLTKLIPNSISSVKIDGQDPDGSKHLYRFVDPILLPPSYQLNGKKQDLTPQMARRKSRTYQADIFISVVKHAGPTESSPIVERRDNIQLGSIPVMLRSKLCHLYQAKDAQLLAAGEDPKDCFQYFIVSGSEKVVLAQEKLATNRIFIMRVNKKDGPVCRLTVETDTSTQVIELGLDKETQSILELRLPGLKITEGDKGKGRKKNEEEEYEDADLNIQVKKKTNEKRYGSINVLHALQILNFGCDENGVSSLDQFRSYIKEFIPKQHQGGSLAKLFATEIDFKVTSDYRDQTIGLLASRLYKGEYPLKMTLAEANNKITDMFDRDLFPQLNYLPLPESEKNPAGEPEEARLTRIRSAKVTLLCIMIAQLLEHLAGYTPATDRNSWSNKKVEPAGRLFLQLFNAALRKQVSLIRYKAKKLTLVPSMETLVNSINPNLLSEIFYSSLNTSTWGVRSGNKKINYARSLTREALVAGWSDVTRVDVNVDRNGNAGEVQNMHTSSFGFICSVDTPEGENCGLLKNLAVTTRLSLKVSDSLLLERIINGGYTTQAVEGRDLRDKLMVGTWFLGWCYDGEALEAELKSWRRRGLVPGALDMTVVREGGWIHVDMSASRPMRPVLVVNTETQRLVIDELDLRQKPVAEWFARGAIEYISPWEQEQIKLATREVEIVERNDLKLQVEQDLVEATALYQQDQQTGYVVTDADEKLVAEYDGAMGTLELEDLKAEDEAQARATIVQHQTRYEQVATVVHNKIKYQAAVAAATDFATNQPYTHCEIDPKTQFSVQANLIHYPEHNQGPRNSYQANMGKQVLGTYHINYRNRFDGTIKLLDNAQTPICSTVMYSLIGLHQRNVGTQAKTLFAAIPFTEEDAFVVNKQFLEAGGQRMIKYMTYKLTRKVAGEELRRPRTQSSTKKDNGHDKYHAIEEGLPYIGAYLQSGDCVIAKETEVSDGLRIDYINTSSFVKPGDEGVVEAVSVESNQSEEIVTVKLRLTRVPALGDKMAASSAQKGTIAAIWSDVVQYRDETGTAASITTNPSSIPSRMTMSYPTEQFWSTAAALTGETANASAFYQENDPNEMMRASELFHEYGRHPMAYHYMTSGCTGEALARPMNMGLVQFQSLRHHAKDKFQARSVGLVRAINHQPPKGKVKKGGLRIGEMERDVFLSHGASGVVLERLMRTSDIYVILLCTECGTIVTGNVVESGCLDCGNTHRDKFVVVKIPYAVKLLIHYLATLMIRISLGAITSDQYAERILGGQRDLSVDLTAGSEDREFEDPQEDLDAEKEENFETQEYYDDSAAIEAY